MNVLEASPGAIITVIAKGEVFSFTEDEYFSLPPGSPLPTESLQSMNQEHRQYTAV